MRRKIVYEGSGQLKYEIREIVDVAKKMEQTGLNIRWENIGDPVQKGEAMAPWIKNIVSDLVMQDESYAYVPTTGHRPTCSFLASLVNKRGGTRITENDIIFFNGLGDAISTLFTYLKRESRVIGPSPAYSTLSSAEAAHSGYQHTTYKLDPDNNWMPDLNDLEQKAKYNDSIAGILLINPDNPTGAVYPKEMLESIVEIARQNDLFVMCDETYAHVIYNGAETCHLSEVIGDVPGMALRSISKEFPWPGGRCGWLEVFNRKKDEAFDEYIQSLINAKRLEVCSTSLPQRAIPPVFSSPEYIKHLDKRNSRFGERAREAYDFFKEIPGIQVNLPRGAFYFTVLFEEGVTLKRIKAANPEAEKILDPVWENSAPDKRFVYNLLATEGICVVPLTGFCSRLQGFRMTLLESDDLVRHQILSDIRDFIQASVSKDE